MTVLPRLMQKLKGASAALAGKELHKSLRWAQGYNLESVSSGSLARIARYVAHQHLHHADEAIPGWPTVTEDATVIDAKARAYLAAIG